MGMTMVPGGLHSLLPREPPESVGGSRVFPGLRPPVVPCTEHRLLRGCSWSPATSVRCLDLLGLGSLPGLAWRASMSMWLSDAVPILKMGKRRSTKPGLCETLCGL